MKNLLPVKLLTVLVILLAGAQSARSQQSTADVQALVRSYHKQLQLPNENDYVISDWHKDQTTGITFVYIQQKYQDIRVFNKILSCAFRNDVFLYASGSFIKDIATKVTTASPSLSALTAVTKAAEHLQLPVPTGLFVVNDLMSTEKKIILNPAGIAKQNISAQLYWTSNDDGNTVHLTWNVNIDVLGSSSWWNVRVDALTGTIVEKDNWTVSEQFPKEQKFVSRECYGDNRFITPPSVLTTAVTNADYNVVPFPNDNPNVGGIAVDHNPWLKAGVGNNAITNGWHYDGTTDYTTTRGSNVHAYLDLNGSNTPSAQNFSAASSTPIPSLTFNFTPNFTQPPGFVDNKNFALTNLFYWNNLMHDVYYQFGFTEVAGNFQADNLGRGGLGSDYVQAEAQDGSGTDNANFATPNDGSRPRMQMYLFGGSTNMTVNSPAAIAGSYFAVESNFSTANQLENVGPVTGQVVYFNDNATLGTPHRACDGVSNNNISGKIALIRRGVCNFTVKVKNAQNSGAIAVIMVDTVAGESPIIMGGTDNTITIPAVMVSLADGNLIASQLANNVNVTLSAGVGLDGDIDNGVVCHEFGHGISNRLTGGPANSSCLQNAEQGGEGWSDYVALLMTTNWATTTLADSTKPRPMGTYVLGQPLTGPGIRRYPYCTDMAVNPLTYGNVDGSAAGSESHNIGEVWCSALWDMTWNIIKQTGTITPNIYNSAGTGGNVIAANLVLMGMKLQPCSPGFLDARNAILAADSILYGFAHKCTIWKAFAARGMGYSAIQGSSNSTADNTPAFDLPGGATLARTIMPVAVMGGTSYTINLSATCACNAPLTNYKLVDTIPAGFTYSSSSGGTVAGQVVTFNSINFNTPFETKNFSIVVTATGAACYVDSLLNDNRDNSTVGGFTSVAALSANAWAQSSTLAHTGLRSWYGVDATDSADFSLVSGAFTPQNLSFLSFWHRFGFETGYDGGRIEISTDGGGSWQNASTYIFQSPYNAKATALPWGNGGSIYGNSSNGWMNTLVNLVPFNNQSIKVRFRIKTDNGNPGALEGWYIDEILALRGCGGYAKAALFNNIGTRIDTLMQPLFITPVTGINDPVSVDNIIKIFPNPASAECSISFHVEERARTTVSIVNLNGQVIKSYNKGTLVSGNYSQTISAKALPAGMYFVVLETGNQKVYKKLVVTH